MYRSFPKIAEVIEGDLIAAGSNVGLRYVFKAWLFSPQLRAVWLYRLSSFMLSYGVFGRILSKYFELKLIREFGCHISPHASIGRRLSLPHPTGIVIGKGARIGEGATIYQGVTVGLRRKDASDYPELGDGCIVYAGAVIVGDVNLANHTVIAANALIMKRTTGATK